tara:strand:- start:933 stop:1034 length:102 start_codon:yes stop_codon:yes gene_type:complete
MFTGPAGEAVNAKVGKAGSSRKREGADLYGAAF